MLKFEKWSFDFMNIAIVEDEIEWQETLKKYLETYLNQKEVSYEVKTFLNGEDFLSSFFEGEFDLIFMDIDLGKDKIIGTEVSRRLREIDDEAVLIFVTNLAQYAIEGYSVDALDFIVKPLVYDPFRMKMEKAYKIINSRAKEKNVIISVEKASKKILAKDVYYVEISNHDLYYHTKDEEYKVRSSLKNVMEQLDGLSFAQCNSCYLVNLAYVERVEKDMIVLSNGSSLKMPRTRRKEFLKALGDYLSGIRK